MAIIYGVYSGVPANTKLSYGCDLYSWVTKHSESPLFWGRDIFGDNRITKDEAEFLHEKNCMVMLVLNEFMGRNITDDVLFSVETLKNLGVPEHEGTALFNSKTISYNYMISYAYKMLENGYIPGFIMDIDSTKNYNNYVREMGYIAKNSTVYWDISPKYDVEPTELVCKSMDLCNGETLFYEDRNISVSKIYGKNEYTVGCMW